MERSCVSAETAEKLKAAGFPQKTSSVWERSAGIPPSEYYLVQPELIRRYGLWGSQELKEVVAAPTAQELADEIPSGTSWAMFPSPKDETAGVRTRIGGFAYSEVTTMAEALAAVWLKLQEAK